MNPGDKTKVTVNIYGVPYRLMSSSSEAYVKKVAALVDEQMHRIAEMYPRLDMSRLAVLAAINIADEYFKHKSETEQMHLQMLQGQDATEEVKVLREKYARLKEEYGKISGRLDEQQKLVNDQKQQLEEQRRRNEDLLKELRFTKNHYEEKLAEYEEKLLHYKEQERREQILWKDYRNLQEDYRNLQEEYSKLQQEYNEWIQLAGLDQASSGSKS